MCTALANKQTVLIYGRVRIKVTLWYCCPCLNLLPVCFRYMNHFCFLFQSIRHLEIYHTGHKVGTIANKCPFVPHGKVRIQPACTDVPSRLLQSLHRVNPYIVYVCKVYADLLLQLLPRGKQCIKRRTDGTSGSSRQLLAAFNFHRYIVHRNNFCSHKKFRLHQVPRLRGALWTTVGMIIIHIMPK